MLVLAEYFSYILLKMRALKLATTYRFGLRLICILYIYSTSFEILWFSAITKLKALGKILAGDTNFNGLKQH